jgi:hypothetical protein
MREMRHITIRIIRSLLRIADEVLKTDLPMDIWLDSTPFEARR